LEYGVDHWGEMNFHLNLVRPQIAVLTGINPTHSDKEHLGSIENIILEKKELLLALPKSGLAILNGDDPQARKMAQGIKAKVLFYGTDSEDDFSAQQIKVSFKGTTFALVYRQGQEKKKIEIKTGLIGRHFVQACLAAVAVGLNQSLNIEQIKRALGGIKPLPGRLSIEKGPQGTILLNDSLRANPASTLAGLQTLADLPTKGKRIAVLGEMGELGDSAEKEHRLVGEKAFSLGIDFLLGIGPLQRLTIEQAVKSGMNRQKTFWANDVLPAAEFLKKILKAGDLFYLKGSRLRHLERILLLLEGEKVGCQVVSCYFYHHCRDCPFLKTGI
jgi:UDP-N-acetylmuramyl pentapeptide synthase